MKKGKIYIGTSGWHYKHWMGTFYPSGMKSKDFMDYYLKFFRTVELNNSFYMLPPAKNFEGWSKSVPKDFLFSVKASRYITHNKKLKDGLESFANFIENAKHLKENLGPILFQLPPGWKFNEERFREFTDGLPAEYRYAFEFRNPTWYNEIAYEQLRKKNIAFCIYELEYHMSPIEVTADYVYIRLHGPETKYAGSYSDKVLAQWANRCLKWKDEGRDVYFYFDNDQLGYSAYNAKKLIDILHEEGGNKKNKIII